MCFPPAPTGTVRSAAGQTLRFVAAADEPVRTCPHISCRQQKTAPVGSATALRIGVVASSGTPKVRSSRPRCLRSGSSRTFSCLLSAPERTISRHSRCHASDVTATGRIGCGRWRSAHAPLPRCRHPRRRQRSRAVAEPVGQQTPQSYGGTCRTGRCSVGAGKTCLPLMTLAIRATLRPARFTQLSPPNCSDRTAHFVQVRLDQPADP